jgi:hypothetical protein
VQAVIAEVEQASRAVVATGQNYLQPQHQIATSADQIEQRR